MPSLVETLADVHKGGHGLFAVCRNAGCRHIQKVDINRVVRRVDAKTKLLPGPHERHFTDAMRCTACRWRGVTLWVQPAQAKVRTGAPRPSPMKEPNFTVVDHGAAPYSSNTVIATADNMMVGKGAYVAAALFYADRRITLKQGIFVVEDSKSGKPIEYMSEERIRQMRHGEDVMAGRVQSRDADSSAVS
jgi:hypothetical protein